MPQMISQTCTMILSFSFRFVFWIFSSVFVFICESFPMLIIDLISGSYPNLFHVPLLISVLSLPPSLWTEETQKSLTSSNSRQFFAFDSTKCEEQIYDGRIHTFCNDKTPCTLNILNLTYANGKFHFSLFSAQICFDLFCSCSVLFWWIHYLGLTETHIWCPAWLHRTIMMK